MEMKLKLNMVKMPNFITGIVSGQEFSIPVSELTKEQAEEFGEEMKQAFIQHHKYKDEMKSSNSGLISKLSN